MVSSRARRWTAAACLGGAVLVAPLAGCDFTDGFDEDPNQATSAPANLLLAAGQIGVIQVATGDFARVGGLFSRQFTGSDRQYSTIFAGNVTGEDFDNTWIVAYQEGAAQLRLAQAAYEEAGNDLGAGIAKVHQAYIFGTLADLFGDIPFTQSLDLDENRNPTFDDQASVYAGVQSLLDQAISDFNSTTSSTQEGDVFGLTRAQYIEVAHSLKARFYLHTAEYDQAASEARQGISAPANNLSASFPGVDGQSTNLFFTFTVLERAGYLTANNSYAARLLDQRRDLDAPETELDRYDFYFTGPLETATLNNDRAFNRNSPFPIITFAETQLILAEATLLSDGSSDDARAALNRVRAANAVQFPGDDLDDLDDDDFDSDDDLLREILTEKYLTLIGNIEAFTDVRRTDNFIGVPPGTTQGIPQRFIYPQIELNANTSAPTQTNLFTETPVNASINYTGT